MYYFFPPEPQTRRDHPLNLSISINGGRETNHDSPSNGERSEKSSNLKFPVQSIGELWLGEATFAMSSAVEDDLERQVGEGDSLVHDAATVFRESGFLECCPKWVANSIES